MKPGHLMIIGFVGLLMITVSDLNGIDSSLKTIAAVYKSPEYEWAEAVMRGKKCDQTEGDKAHEDQKENH